MSNRFTSLSPACLRSQRLSFLIIAALCFNSLPLSAQAIIPLSAPGAPNQQVERRPLLLSDHDYSVSPDLARSQAGQNPPGRTGQQDQPIRVKTELIDLRAVVTDKRGKAITDLKKEDFELMENGKPREVSFFSVVNIPGRGNARQTVETPANGTTDVPAGVARPAESIGRTVLLYVDTLHLSPQSLLSVKQSLRKFIGERLTDQDLTAIVTSAGSLGVVEQFTRDRRVLRYAVDRLSSRPDARDSLFTPYIAGMVDRGDRDAMQVARAIYIAEESAFPNDPTIMQMVQMRARQVLSEATYLRRATLITLKEVVQKLSDMPGQRLLVMVSDGFTLFDTGGGQDTNDLQSVTSRATRSGVVIYSIDAKGLQPPALFSASLGNIPNDPRISSYVSAGERDLENGLNALAKDTGGEAFFNTNDTAGAMGRALDDNQVYYTLGYYPVIDESDKKFRKITIRVKNHPEYEVRAQRGYMPADLAKQAKEEEAKTPQQRFINAMLAPLPLTDIGVTAIPDFVEIPEDNAQVSLQIHIDGKTLTYREENGRRRFDAEIVTMIYNSEGKRVDLKSENISGNLTPERVEIAKQSGFLYTRRVQLKPGLYQIRVGVTEPANERTGTAAAWIESPDLSKKNRPAISSLFLSDAMATGIQEPASNNEPGAASTLSKLVQGVRYYKAGQPIVYFFRLYNLANDQAETGAMMQIEIMQDEKPILTLPWQPVTSRQIGKDAKGLVVGGQFAMRSIQPGIYDMRVSIKDSKMKRPVQRSVPFGIEP
ncbi:MAG TPA: VWA domain-containing protein [Blastocatellia bacterium]|nr:VWA domain-containing protein [Blastocatellia bacterium]